MSLRIKNDTFGIADLQTKMLELLEELIRICDENNLTYFACGGTCIGALRHDGFIPWDDDLDVFMPRPDYEKLWTIREKFQSDKYKLCRTTEEKNYHHRVLQLVDINTTFINKRSINEDIEHGVYIDILPIDACAPTKIGRFFQTIYAILFSVYNVQTLPEFHGGRMYRMLVGLALALVPNKKLRYRIWKKCERKMSRYDWNNAEQAIEVTASLKALLHPYPRQWFAKTKKHKFEDIQINLPIGAEQYLTHFFGDYMKLPPEKDRYPRHKTVMIDLENGYIKYKGKFYMMKQN